MPEKVAGAEDVANDVALDILDSIDVKTYRAMVNRYPDIDPNFVIESAPASADSLLEQYAEQYEHSKEVREAAAELLASFVYSMIENEATSKEE